MDDAQSNVNGKCPRASLAPCMIGLLMSGKAKQGGVDTSLCLLSASLTVSYSGLRVSLILPYAFANLMISRVSSVTQ